MTNVISTSFNPVNQTLDTYETWLRSTGASEQTVACRIGHARGRLTAWPDVQAVDTDTIRTYLAQPHFARWTRVTYYNHCRSLFGWLRETDRIAVEPMTGVKRPSQPKGIPKPLNEREVALVLANATGRVRSWILLGLLSGLRAHEIAKIRGEDVTEDSIFVNGKGGVEAFLPTHPALWALAASHPVTGYWFPSWAGDHVQADTVTAQVGKLFHRLGIEGSIHRTRHTYGTRLLRSGVNIRIVQTLLRHASLATTEMYCEVDEDERRAAVNLLRAA